MISSCYTNVISLTIYFVNQLIHEIIAEYGTEDLDLLQQKLNKMRILENIELPNSVLELLNISEEISVIDPSEDVDVSDEKVKALEEEKGKEEDDTNEEEKEDDDGDDQSGGEESDKKTKVTFRADPKQPMMVRMANLCVAGGFSVNGVAEIHSEIVKETVFNEFYQVKVH